MTLQTVWELRPIRDIGTAQILRNLLLFKNELLQFNPNLPLPQNSCCFFFKLIGDDLARPISIQLAFHLWQYDDFKGNCQKCDGVIYTVGMGGLLSVGGLIGFCSSCGTKHFRWVGGGLTGVGRFLLPYMEHSGHVIVGFVFGGCVWSDRKPLYDALVRVGAIDMPDREWIGSSEESEARVSLDG